MRPTAHLLFVLALPLILGAVQAQTLHAPSNTVFRCEDKGKVHYSDAPCLGAKRVEVEPTRGLDRMTGATRRSSQRNAELRSEAIREALRPLTGSLTAAQWERRKKRSQLPAEAQIECSALDRDLVKLETREAKARPDQLTAVQRRLHETRLRFRKLRC